MPRPSEVRKLSSGGIGIWPGDATHCERMLLAQAELRQPIGFDWRIGGDDWSIGIDERPSWVLFADAGRPLLRAERRTE